MAVNAKFSADFTSFTDAVAKAEVSLDKFQGSTASVERSLNRMVDGFSGRKVIADATLMAEAVERIGGVSKLSEAELARVRATAEAAGDKLRAFGVEVPPQLQRLNESLLGTAQASEHSSTMVSKLGSALSLVGFAGVTATLVSMGRAVLDDADALEKMHDKTGISEEALQQMRLAGDDAGVSLDTMTASVNMLQKRLGGDDASATAALKGFGLSVEAFKALGPAQQMEALSRAVQETHDPLVVADRLSALFGKGWAEMLPVLKRGFQEVVDGTRVMSSGTVKALDDAGDAVGRMYRTTKTLFGEALADVLTGTLASWRALDDEIDRGSVKIDHFAEAEKRADAATAKATKVQDEWNASLAKLGKDEPLVSEAIKKHDDAIRSLDDTLSGRGALKSAKLYAEALEDIGGKSKLTSKETTEMVAKFQEVVDKFRLMGPEGKGVADHFADLVQSLQPVPPHLADIERGLIGVGNAVDNMGQKIKPALADVAHLGQQVAAVIQQELLMVDVTNYAALGASLGGRAGYGTTRYQGGVDTWGVQNPGVLPRFAGGVTDFAGGMAIVGERGPEAVYLPRGSSVVPNGGGGINLTINVTQPFGTPDAIAQAVSRAQVDLLRRQGVRLPLGA